MSESVAWRLAALRRLPYTPPLIVWPKGEWADSMGIQMDLKVWTVAVDPGPCSRVWCTHPIRIRRSTVRERRSGNSVLQR